MDFWLSEWSEAATDWNRTNAQQWRQRESLDMPRQAVSPENVNEEYHKFIAEETQRRLAVYCALGAAAVVLALLANLSGQYAGARARSHLHTRLLSAFTRSRKEFFEHTPVGRIINRFSSDVSFIDKVRNRRLVRSS